MKNHLPRILASIYIGCFALISLAEAGPIIDTSSTGNALPPILEGVKKILFYGDSLTDGSSFPDMVVNTLNREFPEAGFEIINAGNCGNAASNLVMRLATDVLSRDPDLVIITIGTNDCMYDRPVDNYRNDILQILNALKRHGIKVMLVLPSSFTQALFEDRFQRYLEVLKNAAAERHLPVADAHGAFLDAQKRALKVLGPDGVHHGPDGFQVMARAVLDAFTLKNISIDTITRPWPGLQLDWETSAPVPYVAATNNPTLTTAANWQPFDRAKAIETLPWYDADFARRGAWMPFATTKPPAKSMAFGRTFYTAANAGPADLQIGGSGPMVVWVNGVEVWRTERSRGYHPDAQRIRIALQSGSNTIVVMADFMAFAGVRPVPRQ